MGLRLHRFSRTNLRAAAWALRELRHVRRRLKATGLEGIRVTPPPPDLPATSRRAVLGTLRRVHATCLERSAVVQAWEAAHGRERDIIIGVTSPADGFHAHAWLDGERAGTEEFTELTRVAARR